MSNTQNTPKNSKELREPSGDVVMHEGGVEYHCETEEEAIDLSEALNIAPESDSCSWDAFMKWAKRENHPILAKYNYI